MKTVDQYMRELTDDQIEQAYLENEDWRKTGILQDGVLRDVFDKMKEENEVHIPIHIISEPLLYEMVQRYRLTLGK